MKLHEAYNILGLPPSSTPDEAKKKFRELGKKYHPDLNKSPDAEDQFKKINEAYQCIQAGKDSNADLPNMNNIWQSMYSNPFYQNIKFDIDEFTKPKPKSINLTITLSFKESVLGCKKELKFNRPTKCEKCEGAGTIHVDNGCEVCKGKGQVFSNNGNIFISRTCHKCHGKTKNEECKVCKSFGYIEKETTVSVTIPGGIVNDNILRLKGMGAFHGSFMGMDQYEDAYLTLKVIPENNLSLQGSDVISNLNISLLEALQGCEKNISTILGEQSIVINSGSKHHDEIIIPKHGVNKTGNHKVILNIDYPKNIEKLIQILSEEK